jgi:hypothetical protein
VHHLASNFLRFPFPTSQSPAPPTGPSVQFLLPPTTILRISEDQIT